MYDQGPTVGAVTVTGGTAAVTMLPNTGSGDMLLQLAISVAVGMLAWGIFYAYAQKRAQKNLG